MGHRKQQILVLYVNVPLCHAVASVSLVTHILNSFRQCVHVRRELNVPPPRLYFLFKYTEFIIKLAAQLYAPLAIDHRIPPTKSSCNQKSILLTCLLTIRIVSFASRRRDNSDISSLNNLILHRDLSYIGWQSSSP